MSSVSPWESIGGDVKFLRLQQRNVAGLVTDGSVRDTDAIRGYGFPVFCHSTTAHQGPAAMQPWAVNEVVSINKTVVRPGDYIVGDQDGVVVIPQSVAVDVLRVAKEREEVEEIIKEELVMHPVRMDRNRVPCVQSWLFFRPTTAPPSAWYMTPISYACMAIQSSI